jgi:site-specific DNA recombinase
MQILSNDNYTGNLILQKTFRADHLSKRKVLNSGELDRYVVTNHHEPIITKELFDKVQETRKERASKIKLQQNHKHSPFQGMIRCGICGRAYTHKTTPYNEIWKCSLSVTKGKEACAAKQVSHNIIVESSYHILNKDRYSEAYFNSKVNWVIVMPNRTIQFQMKDGTSKEFCWKESSRSESWTPEMKEKASKRAFEQHRGGVHHG